MAHVKSAFAVHGRLVHISEAFPVLSDLWSCYQVRAWLNEKKTKAFRKDNAFQIAVHDIIVCTMLFLEHSPG